MTSSTLTSAALSFVTAAVIGLGGLEHVRAADLDLDIDANPVPSARLHAAATMRQISSDETARFLWLGINKSKVFEFSRDIKEILIGSKGGGGGVPGAAGGGGGGGGGDSKGGDEGTAEIVKVVVLSKRRVNIIGTARGRTDVYFYDANGREIGALDIAVKNVSPSTTTFDVSGKPIDTIIMYRGGSGFHYLACSYAQCDALPASRDDTDVALQAAKNEGGTTTNSGK